IQPDFPDGHYPGMTSPLLELVVVGLPGGPGLVGVNAHRGEDGGKALRQGDGLAGAFHIRPDGDHLEDTGLPCPLDHLVDVFGEALVVQVDVGVDEHHRLRAWRHRTWLPEGSDLSGDTTPSWPSAL